MRAADITARASHVAGDEDPDGAGVADGGVDADGAGEDPANRVGHDLLQVVGRHAGHVDRAHADDEDIARGIDHLVAAGIDRAVEVDHHRVAGRQLVVGPVGRPGAREGAGEQLGAVERNLGGVRQVDLDDRRLELLLRDRRADRGRPGGRARERICRGARRVAVGSGRRGHRRGRAAVSTGSPARSRRS